MKNYLQMKKRITAVFTAMSMIAGNLAYIPVTAMAETGSEKAGQNRMGVELENLTPGVDYVEGEIIVVYKPEDFEKALDTTESVLGVERARAMHVHFSTIEFGPSGEKRHRTFADESFGPRFEHLAPLLIARGYAPRIICECHGTMAEDAKAMLEIYRRAAAVPAAK